MSTTATNSLQNAELKQKVDEWLNDDFYEPTRNEVQQLVNEGNEQELIKRMLVRIAFGTAGLRARMAAGYACMNPLIIIQTTQGLEKYIEEVYANDLSSAKQRGVTIGYDGRHNSALYAQLTAIVFLSKGYTVYLYKHIVGTPFVPYAVRMLKNVAGIMITASHNPKADNGYKLYWHNGCQIIEPHDVNISNHISKNLQIWPDVKQHVDLLLAAKESERFALIADKVKDPESIIDNYFKDIVQYSFNRDAYDEQAKQKHEKIVFTAMHGVGAPFVRRAFETFNLNPYVPVKEQIEADPEFPTVAYPNPEEGKGALAISIATAEREGSRLILANDPDADRLAVAERQDSGEWRIFNGNEIGFLLAHWAWVHYKKQHPDADYSKVALIASTVSSKILRAMAKKEGLRFEETLTGFKWIGNKADELINEGNTFLFGYEVEIGFLVGDISLDKDGIRCAAIFAEMAQELYQRENYSLSKHLNALYSQYGYYMMKTRYFFVPTPAVTKKVFDEIRSMSPDNSYPTEITHNNKTFKIKSVRDLTLGYDSSTDNKKPVLPVTPDAQMITFTFEDDENGGTGVCTLRNSGTEPKLKWYVEVSDFDRERASKKLDELTVAVIEQLIKPTQNNLVAPSD